MILTVAVLTGLSAGILSICSFLGIIAGLNPFISVLIGAVAWGAAVMWLRPTLDAARLESSRERPTPWILITFAIVAVVAAVAFIAIAGKEPHGDWDAYSIWNLHARFLARGGAGWTAMFSKEILWSHPDYPLLLPALVAQFWLLAGSQSQFVPIAIAFLFTFGTVASVIGALRILRGWDQALIAGAFLLGGAELVAQGITQYADIPLAFYIVTALALLFFDDAKCAVLSGAMAGFAAWTKNEGLLFLVVLLVARVIMRLRFGSAAGLARELVLMAAGAAPALATLAVFKLKYATANDLLFAHKSSELLARVVDFGRFVTVIEAFVVSTFRLGGFLIPGVLALGLYAWLVRFKPDPRQHLGLATVVAAVALMLLGDFAVYQLLSNDVDWQLGTSLPRVFFQIWPAALLGFFAAASKLDLAIAPVKQSGAVKQKESKKMAGRAAASRRY